MASHRQLGHGAWSLLFGPWCEAHILPGRLGKGVIAYTSGSSPCSPHSPDSPYGQGDKTSSLHVAPHASPPVALLFPVSTFLTSVFPEGPSSFLDSLAFFLPLPLEKEWIITYFPLGSLLKSFLPPLSVAASKSCHILSHPCLPPPLLQWLQTFGHCCILDTRQVYSPDSTQNAAQASKVFCLWFWVTFSSGSLFFVPLRSISAPSNA